MKRHRFALPLFAATVIVVSGCGEEANPGKFPEGSHPGRVGKALLPDHTPQRREKGKIG